MKRHPRLASTHKMALMFEKALAAAVVIGLGSNTVLKSFPASIFNASALLFSKATAPFLNDGEDLLDVSARCSVFVMTVLGTVLQERWLGSSGDTIAAILLFGNSLWSMFFFIYSMDPVGLYRMMVAFAAKNKAMAEFGRLDPEFVKAKMHEQKFNIVLSKSELNAATNPRSIHKVFGFEIADEGGRRLGAEKTAEGGVPAVVVTGIDNRSAAYASGVRLGMVLTHLAVCDEGDKPTARHHTTDRVIPLMGMKCDQVDKKLIALQNEPADSLDKVIVRLYVYIFFFWFNT